MPESNPPFLPLLVTGVHGLAGFNAYAYFHSLYGDRVKGVVPAHIEIPEEPDVISLVQENKQELETLFSQVPFRSVIDVSGWCKLKPAEYAVDLAETINIIVGRNFAELAAESNARLIRVSSDLVFDGNPRRVNGESVLGNYSETDEPNPVTVYGRTMLESEKQIMDAHPEAAILRMALPMGPSFNGHAGAIDWICSRFVARKPATLYFDEVRSNIYVQDLNRIMHFLLEDGFSGIYHAGGPLALSLFQIGQIVNRQGGFEPRFLQGCMRTEAGPMPPRAGNVSMDSRKLEQILPEGMIRPWPSQEDMIPVDMDWHVKRPDIENRFAIIEKTMGYGPIDQPLHPWAVLPQWARDKILQKLEI